MLYPAELPGPTFKSCRVSIWAGDCELFFAAISAAGAKGAPRWRQGACLGGRSSLSKFWRFSVAGSSSIEAGSLSG